MGDTSIEWTDKTWSPIRAQVKRDAPQIAILHGWKELAEICEKMKGHVGPHCEVVSSGCNHCYSCTNNHRCLPSNGTGLPFDKRSRELVDIFVDEKILIEPLSWKKPQKVFVENQSDLFGEWVPFEFIDKVFAVMALTPQHTYQILTKRPERMREYFKDLRFRQEMVGLEAEFISGIDRFIRGEEVEAITGCADDILPRWDLPFKNVWLGVSIEDQRQHQLRAWRLRETPAACHFISYEPALEKVEFDLKGIDWLIVGGESGPGARPFNLQWARDVIAQCKTAGVACFVKQLGTVPIISKEEWRSIQARTGRTPMLTPQHQNRVPDGFVELMFEDTKAGWMSEWPEDLRVREFPAR